ncbi:hypothetical protein [Candidatus Sodalis pierantonius]|uniref:hypothetical protein n=1 Tax=Candidatus Sodalis pierantonii TaxID=1486991 RepID=UPI0011DCECC1|nr:hypothetical protein [Candidatus Sodalis pierantonius]
MHENAGSPFNSADRPLGVRYGNKYRKCFFSNTLSAARIGKIMENKGESLPTMTLWEKIKDFFFNGDTQKCLFILNELCHPPATSQNATSKSILNNCRGWQIAATGFTLPK